MRADLFRLAYLAVRGGLYADADDRCRHSLREWLAPGIVCCCCKRMLGCGLDMHRCCQLQ
ncbi:MAG: hypothetical protein K9L88_11885 [Chromatiaceae bacterium]|nr:hypothetical protein [Chromatiaceae bacterium]